MHLAKYCCQHLKKVERIFNAPLTKVKCKGVVKLSASSVNYKGIIATHSIGGGLALATMHKDAFRLSRLVMIGYLLKPSQNKNSRKQFLAATIMVSFSQWPAVKNDIIFGAARNFFWPFLFRDGFSDEF